MKLYYQLHHVTATLTKLCICIAVVSFISASWNTFRWYVSVTETCATSKESSVEYGVHPRGDVGHTYHPRHFLKADYKVMVDQTVVSGYRIWHSRLYANSLEEAKAVHDRIDQASCLAVFLPNSNPQSMVLIRPSMFEIWNVSVVFILASILLMLFQRRTKSNQLY